MSIVGLHPDLDSQLLTPFALLKAKVCCQDHEDTRGDRWSFLFYSIPSGIALDKSPFSAFTAICRFD